MADTSQCGNPLLRDWVAEWMENAKTIQSKAYYTYKKAHDSLCKCPVTFSHPSEAQQLHGIGEGMAKRLEKKMIKHCKDHNLPPPVRPRPSNPSTQADSDAQPPRRARAPQIYVPRFRSGAYAILLYLHQIREQNMMFASREQIVRGAQRYCDASFELREPGKNYTAWNNMKTLMEKDLVWKHHSPPKYTLTDAGCEIALRLRDAGEPSTTVAAPESSTNQDLQEDADHARQDDVDLSLYVLDPARFRAERQQETAEQQVGPDPNGRTANDLGTNSANPLDASTIYPSAYQWQNGMHNDSVNDNTDKDRDDDDDDDDDDVVCISTSSFPCITNNKGDYTQMETEKSSDVFEYTYLDLNGNPVQQRTEAQAVFDDIESCLAYHVQFHARYLEHEMARFLIEIVEGDEDTYTAFLLQPVADPVCTGIQVDLPLQCSPAIQPTHDQCHADEILSVPSSPPPQPTSSLGENEPVVYPAGSYEIVLILDYREIRLRSNRNYIEDKLMDRGVKVEKRGLELGDVIWVARRPSSQSSNDEVFLDYIVERKRLDDLVSSIKDGRFHEQKARLAKAGARKVFYIVEEYNKEDVVKFGHSAIQTAMSSTQVINKFFLKRTATIDDTVDFLAHMTRMIEMVYEGVTLYRIPEHLVSRQDYLKLREHYADTQPDRTFVISYPLFNSLNSKNATFNVGDVFRRMLMATRGVSADKANALMKRYPTPAHLLRDYQLTSPERGKRLAKEATEENFQRLRWGESLSERLWHIWCRTTEDAR